MLKKIIYVVVGLLIVGAMVFYYFEQKGEKEMQAFLGENNSPASVSAATSTEVVAPKTYTFGEVQKHNTKNDCWMVINSKVVDVTSFIDKHPGGNAILKGCGIDATQMFNGVSGHLKGVAVLLLKKLYIGDLAK